MDYFDEEFEEILDRFKSHKKAYGDFAPGSWENLFDTDEETRRNVPPAEVPLSNYDYHYEPKSKTESRFAAFLRRLGGEKEVVADEPVDQD